MKNYGGSKNTTDLGAVVFLVWKDPLGKARFDSCSLPCTRRKTRASPEPPTNSRQGLFPAQAMKLAVESISGPRFAFL